MRFPLRQARQLPGLLTRFAVNAVTATMLAVAVLTASPGAERVVLVVFLALLLLPLLTLRKPESDPYVEIDGSLIRFGARGRKKPREIPLERVDGVAWLPRAARGDEARATVLFRAARDSFFLREDDFEHSGHARIFYEDLLRALGQAPGAAERAPHLRAVIRATELAFSRRLLATRYFVAAILIAYAWQLFGGAFTTPLSITRFGANAGALVQAGQYERLVTANFLHGPWFHLAMNGFALFSLSWMLERLVGPARYVIIYLLAAVAGAGASALWSAGPVSVGASTAVFGLLGALLYIHLAHRDALPMGFDVPLSSWLMTLGMNAALPLVIPQIDFYAHLGGFAGGVLASVVLLLGVRSLPAGPSGLGARIVAAGLVVISLLAIGRSVLRYLAGPAEEVRVAEVFAQDRRRPERLNEAAWTIALHPQASTGALEAAHAAVAHALSVRTASGGAQVILEAPHMLQDTQATVAYRLGRHEEAIRLELAALDAEPMAIYATQLARFLRARAGEGQQPVLLLDDLSFAPPRFRFTVRADTERPHRAYVLALSPADQLLGLVELPVAPGPVGEREVLLEGWRDSAPFLEGAAVVLGEVREEPRERVAPAPRAWAADPEVLRWP